MADHAFDNRLWTWLCAWLRRILTVRLRDWLADAAAISAVIDGDPQEASAHASLITQAQSLADRWPELKPHQAKAYLNALLRRVIVESTRIVIEIDGERALATLLAGPDVVSIKRSRQDAQPAKHPIIGVPLVSWTPNPLGEWRTRCQEQDELIHPSFASR